jgi:TfoX/Sxy family transcriptional regulator of competence genes
MAWEKPPEELKARFAAVLARHGDVTSKLMFGFPAGFVHGNMFAGLFENSVTVKLGSEQSDRFRALGGTDFAPMPGRVMSGFLVVPPSARDSEDELATWVEAALNYVRTLPPKEPKPRAPRRTAR